MTQPAPDDRRWPPGTFMGGGTAATPEPRTERQRFSRWFTAFPSQRFSRWFTEFPSTHVNAGQTVEVMPVAEHEAARARLEAENARLREAAQAVADAAPEYFKQALRGYASDRARNQYHDALAALRAALAPAADEGEPQA